MNLSWHCKKFDELTVHELYAIIRLRNEVFVVEQNCVFQDADDKDQASFHFMGWDPEKLIAYARIVPPGVIYTEASIGRVVISPAARRSGLGRELIQESIKQLFLLFGKSPIRIGAQMYLRDFYKELGFEATGKEYIEDGIDHLEMIKP